MLAYPCDRSDDIREIASRLRDAGVRRSPQGDWSLKAKAYTKVK